MSTQSREIRQATRHMRQEAQRTIIALRTGKTREAYEAHAAFRGWRESLVARGAFPPGAAHLPTCIDAGMVAQ